MNHKNEISHLKKIIEEQKKKIKKLKQLVDYDFLTNIYNRRGFLKGAKKFIDELKNTRREKRKFSIKNFSLIFIDLDSLKSINDLYGHKIGDEYIKACVKVFKNNLREIDIIGRWGGDEFVIGLININKINAGKVVKKIKEKFSKTYLKISGGKIKLSASFGIYEALKSSDINWLIQKADRKMYLEKRNKKQYLSKTNF